MREQFGAQRDGAEAQVDGIFEVFPCEAELIEALRKLFEFCGIFAAQGEYRPSLLMVGFAVLKIGDVEVLEGVVEKIPHGADAFADADGQGNLMAWASAGGAGDVSELEEIDIGTTEDDENAFVFELFGFAEGGGEAEGTGWFGDAAQVFPEAADGTADFVVGDRDETVELVVEDLEWDGADPAHGGAVTKQIELIQCDGGLGFHGGVHGGLAFGFDANDFDAWPISAEPFGDPGSHAAAANLEVGDVEGALAGEHDFVGEGALSGHDVEVIVGMDIKCAGILVIALSGNHGVIVTIATEDDFDLWAAVFGDGLLFDEGS